MKKVTYLAVFESNGSQGYGVFFPDLPGCVSLGENFESARRNAAEALSLHIYGLEKDKDDIPAPSASPKQFPSDSLPQGEYYISPITVYPDIVRDELDNRRVKTNVTIPAWLKEAAEEQGVNYSRLLETALREYLK